jgi:NADH-ubiquinone oxidoreductase chain 6
MLYLLSYGDINQLLLTIVNTVEIIFLLSGLSVIISKNPIVSVLFLISLFLLVSIYLITIGIHFIGISYLLVYIGAVSILFLFILMLIDIRISELHSETMNNVLISLLLGIFIYVPISLVFVNVNVGVNNIFISYIYKAFTDISNEYIKYIYHNSWEGFIVENIDITAIGNILYTNISLWLIISLLILLLAMVGAIVINLDVKPNSNN